MSKTPIFDILLLIARPAAGKSEIIAYLKGVPPDERSRRFHVGDFVEIDDFPMIWAWFEEDALLDKMGHPRLHTDPGGYFLQTYFWDLLIERIGVQYQKKQRDVLPGEGSVTTLIEFSRGREHGGYRSAFSHLSRQILERAALLYVDVTWEESLRKNRKRFNPDRPDSILQHSLSDDKMERLYKETDWDEFSRDDSARRVLSRSTPLGGPVPSRHTDDIAEHPFGMSRQCYISVQGFQVPYVVFDNSDDVTTLGGEPLGTRLEGVLKDLWTLYATR